MKIITDEKNKNEFLKMLAWIELCGNIGHSCKPFEIHVDGDGKGRLKFEFNKIENQHQYNLIKKDLLKQYELNGDIKYINFE